MQEKPRRRGMARALVVLAALIAFFALHAIWLDRQLLNTDNWTASSSKLLDDPAIRAQTAGYLTDQLFSNVDVQAEIASVLPPRAQVLAAPAANLLRERVETRANTLLQRPRVQQLWEDANRKAHELLLRVLNNEGNIVSTQGGVVTLDLRTLLEQLQAQTGVGGRVAAKLPADAAQVTLLRSDQLKTAQDAAKVLDGLPVVLVALSLLLFGAALLASPGWRRQAVRAYGIGLVLAGIGALAVGAIAGQELVNSLATTAAMEPAVRGVWDVYVSLLQQAAVASIFYGAILIVGAWLAGRTSWAVAVRRFLAPYLRETALAYAAFAVLLLVVIAWWAPTPAMRNPVTAILLALLLTAGFEGLRRVTAQEFPPGSPTETVDAAAPTEPAPPTAPAAG
jgi:cell division protein FtsB